MSKKSVEADMHSYGPPPPLFNPDEQDSEAKNAAGASVDQPTAGGLTARDENRAGRLWTKKGSEQESVN